jgi:hypothetical protein
VAGRLYKFGITRTEGGDVSLFLHGGKCASGSPLFSGGYALDTTYVAFFRDEGTENTGGILKHIQFWDRALTPVEMATECGCTLTKAAAACKNTVVYSAPYFRISYSTVWNNDAVSKKKNPYLCRPCLNLMHTLSSQVGQGHGLGRIKSPQAWSVRTNVVGQWMQMDTGEVQSIAGVATQGRRDAAQWVTSIIVQATLIELNYQHLKQN